MISTVAWLLKVLLFTVFGLGIFWTVQEHCDKNRTAIAVACIVMIVGAIGGQTVADLVPPLTDTVTITALGEKNPESNGYEVVITGLSVDGKEYPLKKISNGKWFWYGNDYMWRLETDERQPDGTTRRIDIQVPVGKARTINFNVGQWCGEFTVEYEGKQEMIDSYCAQAASLPVHIAGSDSARLILDQLRCLAVFAVVLWLICSVFARILCHCFTDLAKTRAWFAKNRAVLIIGVIALAQLVFAFKFSGVDSFWLDEMYEIYWSSTSENMLHRAFRGSAPLPIFGVFAGLWYQIAPYGERWLLLPFEIGTACGIFFLGMAGREIRDDRVGIISALLAAISSNVLVQCSYEIRSYAFYFAFAAVLLRLFTRHIKNRKTETWKSTVCLSVVMVLFVGMHYYAVFSCIILFVIDFLFLVLWDRFNIKRTIRLCIPYVVAALSYIPSLVNVVKDYKIYSINNNSWQNKPTFSVVADLFKYFSDQSTVLLLLFVLGLSIALAGIFASLCNRKEAKSINDYILVIPLLWITLLVLSMAIYGSYRYESGVASLWSERYFTGILPAFFVISAIGICGVLDFGKQLAVTKDPKGLTVAILVFLLVVPSSVSGLYEGAHTVAEPRREAADWLYTQGNDIYNKDTLIICADWDTELAGWNEYYLTQQGYRDEINIISQYDVDPADLRAYKKIYVQYIHRDIIPSVQSAIDDNFTLISEQGDIRIRAYQPK